MPEGAQTLNPTPEATPPRGLRGSGLRYGDADDVPTWARGKTADEILEMTDALYTTVQRNDVVEPASPMMSPPSTSVDPNLLYSDPQAYTAAVLAEAERRAEAKLRAEAGSFVTPIASMARAQAQSYQPEVWELYGPQVEAIMARVPAANRADVSVWREAVDMVAGKHWKGLARKEADRLVSTNGDSGMLPTEGGPPQTQTSSLSPIRKLFSDGHPAIKGFVEEGIKPDEVIAHATRMGHDETKYAEMLTRKAHAVTR